MIERGPEKVEHFALCTGSSQNALQPRSGVQRFFDGRGQAPISEKLSLILIVRPLHIIMLLREIEKFL